MCYQLVDKGNINRVLVSGGVIQPMIGFNLDSAVDRDKRPLTA